MVEEVLGRSLGGHTLQFFPITIKLVSIPCTLFPKLFTQWALQTHTSAYQLTFGAKCTNTTNTLHTSPKSCCPNFSKCSLSGRLCHSKYNDLNNTDNLKH